MQYKLHLNLRQRAALRTAISFWERKEIKDKVKEFFMSCDEFKIYEFKKKWRELTKTVMDEWNKDVLPKQLEDELKHIVKMIGETILSWYQYIEHEYKAKKETINCIDEIKWTPYGTVDVVKIFESSWLENPNLDITKVYSFACRYAVGDHINDLWNKIPSDIQNSYEDIYKSFDQHILAYWKHCRVSDLTNLMMFFEIFSHNRQNRNVHNLIYDLNHSVEENMLRLSVYQGYFYATQYFWEQLTEVERDKTVVKCARIAVLCYYTCKNPKTPSYLQSQYVEICIFLMNQMSKSHKKVFFNEKLELVESRHFASADIRDEILEMLLFTWPWQELFIPVLKDMLQYQDENSKLAGRFLDTITKKMVEDHELDYSLDSSRYRSLLREVWLIFSGPIKRHVVQENAYSEFVDNLINVWDLDTLKLMFNDPEIADIRDEFIEIGSFSYRQFIEEDQFENLDKLLEKISRSEEEKKQFKQKINIIWDLMDEGEFHLVNKLLDWQCSTPEERQFAKDSIDHMDFSQELIDRDDYALLGMFLDWKFDVEEEKQKFKDHFKSDIFSIRQICEIWARSESNINSAKDKCYRFLHWFLASEEEIVVFKKRIVVIFYNDLWVINRLAILKRNGVMDDFISWCLLDDEHFQHAQRMKQVVVQSDDRPA